MVIAAPESEYDRAQVEARLEHAPVFMARHVLGVSSSKEATQDTYKHWVVRETHGGDREAYPLGEYSGSEVARKMAQAPSSFRATMQELQTKLGTVLSFAGDPAELEYQALLFWPECNALHSFLGMDPRADEIIAGCDLLRVRFRLEPVTEPALRTLHQIFGIATTRGSIGTDEVDLCYDLLEAVGVEPNYPLSFADVHED